MVTWVDPPPPGRVSKYAGLSEELRTRPGKWALLGDFASYSAGTRFRQRLGAGFEVYASHIADADVVRVWARFVRSKT